MPTLVCPVCGTENDSTRLFCRKCAADLHATAVYSAAGGAAPAPAAAPIPIKPILIGGGIAALAVLLVLGAVIVLGGAGSSPSAAPSASVGPSDATPPSAGPSLTPTVLPTATPAPTAAPTPTADTGPKPTPTDAPPIIRFFTGPATVNCSDPSFLGTIHLSWRIGNADGVNLSIDGPGVYNSYTGVLGAADVPFACDGDSHTYILSTFGGLNPVAEKDLVIGPAPTP